MSIAFLIIWYLFLILLPVGCLVIRIIHDSFTQIIQEMDTYILLAAIIYAGYMITYLSCKSKSDSKDSKKEALISNDSIDICRDHWYKYLFCLCVGTLFLPKLIVNLEDNFSTYSNKNWEIVVNLVFAQIVIPIMVIVDVFMISRRRVPSPISDLLILLGIIIAFIIIELTKQTFSFEIFIKTLGVLISNTLFSFNGYVLYDYILYKKIGGPKGFSLFNK